MAGAYNPLDLKPGLLRRSTEYQSRGRWYAASLVRWYEGTIQPVGGWIRVNNDQQLSGRPCGMLAWRPNSQDIARYLAIGTSSHLYAYDSNDIYDITPVGFVPGRDDSVEGLGYGAGTYGTSTYGTPRSPDGRVLEANTWSLDTWGDYLVGCATSDGKLYEWDLDTGGVADVIANAPTNNASLFVTAERFLVAVGAGGDVRKLQWCSQEDNTLWAAASTNSAGDLPVATDGALMTGVRTRGENIVFTDVDAHSFRYIGAPFIYAVDRIGSNCGLIGPNAAVPFDTRVAWMSDAGFFVYDGYVKPLPCDVYEYVFADINRRQKAKVCAWHNGQFGEIWWHYPSAESAENDRYVVWNYRENHWAFGEMARTAACDRGAFFYPQAAAPDGYWFEHENGWTDNGAERGTAVHAQTGPLEIGNGDRVAAVHKVIHDESENVDSLQMTFIARQTAEGSQTTYGPYALNQANGYTDVRAGGRQLSVLFEETASGKWLIGTNRLEFTVKGKR